MEKTNMRKKVFIALKMSGIAGQYKLGGIFKFLRNRMDWDITLVRNATEFTPERMKEALHEGYHGFIVSIPDTEETAALLADSDIPTIVMDIHDPKLSNRNKNIIFIRNSSKEIGVTAANHLLSIGTAKSYAFLHNPSVMKWSIERFAAFRETLRDYGIWCHELTSLESILKLQRPLGICAANDDCALSIIDFCHTHRLKIPNDVAILGINNDTLLCENCEPRLSSIQPDFELEGYLAAENLSKMIDAANKNPNVPFENATLHVGVKTLVRRESTAEISYAGKMVQKALSYINQNALKGISVDDVAKHIKVSRRLIDLRFRELQNTSIARTIMHIQLKEVTRLLLTTKMSVNSIALAAGYKNPNTLRNLFKKKFSMSMQAFRRNAKK